MSGGGEGAGSQLFSLPDGGVPVLSVNVWDPGTVQDNPHSTEPCPPVIYIQSLTHVLSLKNIMQSSHGSTRWRPEGRQRGVWVHTKVHRDLPLRRTCFIVTSHTFTGLFKFPWKTDMYGIGNCK